MTEQTHSWLGKIRSQCPIMQKIIEDFLDFQAMEDGQIKLTKQSLDLNELVREVVERNSAYAASRKHLTRLELEQGLPLVEVDEAALAKC